MMAMRRTTVRTIRRLSSAVLAGLLITGVLATAGAAASGATSGARATGPGRSRVLYVGSFHGVATPPGATFSTIQAAVNAVEGR